MAEEEEDLPVGATSVQDEEDVVQWILAVDRWEEAVVAVVECPIMAQRHPWVEACQDQVVIMVHLTTT